MEKDPLITIIVPVYKVEDYLEQCLNSIIKQTYKNIEIILIDDGSPDKSPQMCDEWGKKDNRIVVIHKKNEGPADARNEGIKKSKGKYITFIDSDDWVNHKYIEKLYKNLIENNADVSICNYSENPNDVIKDLNSSQKDIFSNLEAINVLLYQKKFETAPHCKLFASELSKKYLYPTGRVFAEDLSVIYKILFNSNKVVYSNDVLYFYRNNPNGITKKKFTYKMFDELDAADEIEAFVKDNCQEILPAALSRKFSAYCQVLRWTKDAPNTSEIQEKRDYIWAFLKKYQWKMFRDKKARLKNRLSAILMIFGQKIFMNF